MSFRSQRSYVHRTSSLQYHYYVFFINEGYTVDIDAHEKATVGDIQIRITEKMEIPVSEQVLVLKNGMRPPENTSCESHNAGTNDNPFYLYHRCAVGASMMKEIDGINRLLTSLQQQVQRTQNTVQAVNKTSQSCIDLARTCHDVCKKIVCDHHNLDEALSAMFTFLTENVNRLFRSLVRFEKILKKMEIAKSEGRIVFDDFASVFGVLKMIPLPDTLAANVPKAETDGHPVSLYDWIRSKDPVFHLDDLVEHVKNGLEELNQKPVNEIRVFLEGAKRQLSDDRNRSVSGLAGRRLALDERRKKIQRTCELLHSPASRISTIDELNALYQEIKEITQTTTTFQNSKDEVLKIIVDRINSVFKSNYDNLKKYDNDVYAFELRIKVLSDQLHLLNQIRETPILYFTAVAEVIRRNTLNEQFHEWFEMAKEKCSNFLDEENKVRSEIDRKLSKHYLRSLFPGMSDQIASFQPIDVVFDTNLPKIPNDYLHLLREKFKDMGSLLNVTAPDVFNRLAIVDKTTPLSVATSQATLRREESFFVHDKTGNIAMMNRNFPSTNYLSGLDVECSPGSFNRFDCYSPGPHHYGESFAAGAVSLKPLFDIGSREDATLPRSIKPRCFSSDPIAIPNSMSASKPLSISSSQFGTPEDHYGSPDKLARQQKAESCDEEKNTIVKETLKETRDAIASYKEELESLRADLKDSDAIIAELLALKQPFEKLQTSFKRVETALESRDGEVADAVVQKEELQKVIEHEKYIRKEKEDELEESRLRLKELTEKFTEQEKQIADQDEKLRQQAEEIEKLRAEMSNITYAKDDLHADILRLEGDKQKLERQIQTDAGVDFLGIELKTLEDILNRELSEEEIERIKLEIEKRRVISPTPSEQNDCSKPSNSSIEYEKALRTKMMFIIRGIEQRKDEEIAKVRVELAAENERAEQLLKEKVDNLEAELARCELEGVAPRKEVVETESAPTTNGLSLDGIAGAGMLDSCMVVNSPPGSSRVGGLAQTEEEHESEEDAVDDDVTPINTMSTQTRISMKEMNMMISLHDIHVGCSVLVMWDPTHTSYMVFTTSRTLYFVRETSMRRLGIDTTSPARRTWMFAIVTHVDYCQIRKENNRYNMPLGTRFYRVDVRPLAIEQSSSMPNMRH
uniref:ATG11 domain-containing protein n=1 Tax=Panagrellus redivivus TaxID=6233 RepID=A0A7E4VK68_PANRE